MLERWNDLCTRLGILDANEDDPQVDQVYHHLTIRYCDRGRHYHNLAHIEHCLREFDAVRDQSQHPEALELAVWFHDIVFDTHQNDNELRSAQMADVTLERLGVDESVRHRVKNLIRATMHQGRPEDRDDQLMVDIDLSTLGSKAEIFDRNTCNIRREFAWMSEEQFNRGQKELFERFMARDAIYCTPYFQQKYEKQARANLTRALDRLCAT